MEGGARIVEVFPRDGLQVMARPDGRVPSTRDKVSLIKLLATTGLPEIEVTGFAHPRVIPQLADAEAVAEAVLPAPEGVVFRANAPNLVGAQRAFSAGLHRIVFPIVVSETYERKNVNMTISEHLRELGAVVALARRESREVVVGVGMCFCCPYEGWMPLEKVLRLIGSLVDVGIRDVILADSVGLARPGHVRLLTEAVRAQWPQIALALHLHDAWGGALASCAEAYAGGMRAFEGSIAGIGGGIAMPDGTTPGGNVATEGLAYLLRELRDPLDIDMRALLQAADLAVRLTGIHPRASLPSGSRLADLACAAPAVDVSQ